jgi:hypothetical protein
MSSTKLTFGLVSAAVGAVMAFQPITTPVTPRSSQFASSTVLKVAVDPTVVTKKEYEDICGVSFDQETMAQRLRRTNFLYPKHVEVVEDIGPIAGAMVDDIVRYFCSKFIAIPMTRFPFVNLLTFFFVLLYNFISFSAS